MSYDHFSTGNADYAQVYSSHFLDTDDDVFNDEKMKSLDAIVLENSGEIPLMTESSQLGLDFLPPMYGTIMKQSHKHGKTIYLLDADLSLMGIPLSLLFGALPLFFAGKAFSQAKDDFKEAYDGEKTGRRQFLKGFAKGLLGMWLVNGYLLPPAAATGKGETHGLLESASSSVHRIPPNPAIEVRSCIAARKIEEFVVPRIKCYGVERPSLAIAFGALHLGMKECLQSKPWRDSVLRLYKEINYLGIDISTLGDVWEMWPSSGDYGDYEIFGQKWNAQLFNCRLF